jgi:hypothetical protein
VWPSPRDGERTEQPVQVSRPAIAHVPVWPCERWPGSCPGQTLPLGIRPHARAPSHRAATSGAAHISRVASRRDPGSGPLYSVTNTPQSAPQGAPARPQSRSGPGRRDQADVGETRVTSSGARSGSPHGAGRRGTARDLTRSPLLPSLSSCPGRHDLPAGGWSPRASSSNLPSDRVPGHRGGQVRVCSEHIV